MYGYMYFVWKIVMLKKMLIFICYLKVLVCFEDYDILFYKFEWKIINYFCLLKRIFKGGVLELFRFVIVDLNKDYFFKVMCI